MRVLLSTIGSRGEAQPVVALALQLMEMGHDAVVCAPPDFQGWAESLGITYVPVGPELRATGKRGADATITPAQARQLVEGTVAAQFDAVGAAAAGCDVVVGGGALAIAAGSIAEHRGARYAYVSFCPITLPSAHHPPPVHSVLGQRPADGTDNDVRWAQDARFWTATWADALNTQREAIGLAPVADVRSHIFTGTPLLAADPTLAPWPEADDLRVTQTGAWLLPDATPLPPELAAFVDAGEPPVYFGFGSVRAPAGITASMIATARALGRRAIVSRGWADLALVDDQPDCIAIGEVNQQALFPRVAAAVHHGGAGTTTAATRAGVSQVIVPQNYDQFYFAQRVAELGIGSAHAAGEATAGSLLAALGDALRPDVVTAARTVATKVVTDGTAVAVRHLLDSG
ncbi:glycosyltransferase [Pseudonocardia sp. TRM90224]|uniref:glycosyltransferase n=1 Tax=Pseudonocardia sp. TRM90224 TaxID=2812678 RepID=UPI001E41B65E|nr:glycosyltransferase [Pseudonocardia sp. TRM90224]